MTVPRSSLRAPPPATCRTAPPNGTDTSSAAARHPTTQPTRAPAPSPVQSPSPAPCTDRTSCRQLRHRRQLRLCDNVAVINHGVAGTDEEIERRLVLILAATI